jgi:hypothetical protein
MSTVVDGTPSRAKGQGGTGMAKKKTEIVKAVRKVTVPAVMSAEPGEVNPQDLMMAALSNQVSIDTIERIMTMAREKQMLWARNQYFSALSGFQSECPVIEKKHKVMDRDRQTRQAKGERYRYAALEDLVEQASPYLKKWGFSYTFKCQQDADSVTAICHAHHRDGHEEVNSFQVPIDHEAYMSDPQKAAAALTFATRYAFKNAFAIQTRGEDRDENLEIKEIKAPLQAPQQRVESKAIPVSHTVELTDHDKIQRYLAATEVDPKTKIAVPLFSENEAMDYTHEANEARGNTEELAKILSDIIETGRKRRAAVKGGQA